MVIVNELSLTVNVQKLHFNQKFVVAVSADLGDDILLFTRNAATETANSLSAVRTLYQRRPWGKAWGSGLAFTDAIQDLVIAGLFKPGRRHERPLDEATFSEKWTFLPTH